MKEKQITSLAVRIEELEQQNRTLKSWMFGFALTIIAILSIGAARPTQEVSEFKTVHAQRIAIRDNHDKDRLVLELNQGEPTLTMFNHDGMRQVYLGINELWGDGAYLSVSSRLRDGAASKQAVLIAKDNDAQLLLYDLDPKQENAARRHMARIATGNDAQKPYLEFREFSKGREKEITRDMLKFDSSEDGRRFLLDTTPEKTKISGTDLSQK